MAIMVNRLNKSKQEQTSMSAMNDLDGIVQTNENGDNQENHPAKVKRIPTDRSFLNIVFFF